MMHNVADFLLVQLSLSRFTLIKKLMIKSYLFKLHQYCTVLSIW